VIDLVEEVFDGAAGEVDTMVEKLAEQDKVAVPAIHLVEAAAGNDVGVGEIKKAGVGELGGVDVAEMFDTAGEMENLDVAVLLESAEFRGELLLLGKIENGGGEWVSGGCGRRRRCGGGGDFDVREGRAIEHGALEAVPGLVNVGVDGELRGLLGWGCGGKQESNEAVAKMHESYDVTPGGWDWD